MRHAHRHDASSWEGTYDSNKSEKCVADRSAAAHLLLVGIKGKSISREDSGRVWKYVSSTSLKRRERVKEIEIEGESKRVNVEGVWGEKKKKSEEERSGGKRGREEKRRGK